MKKNNVPLWIACFSLATVLLACNSSEPSASTNTSMQHNEHHQAHARSGHEFNNKHSVEVMAKQFESPERDSIQQPEKILDHLGDLKGKTLMDIGAGTGYFSVRFAKKGAYVIAADVSDEFQSYLRQRLEENRITNVELRKTPYDTPLLGESEADVVFVANTYHHINKRISYFSKVKKGLKSGGEVIIVDYFSSELPEHVTAPPAEMRVSVDQVVFELREAGFSSFDIDVNSLPYQYIIKARKT